MELLITDFLVEPPLALGYVIPLHSSQQTLNPNISGQMQANLV